MTRPTDADMHYSDGSHRWIAPPDIDQDAWNSAIRVHQMQHRARPDLSPPTPHSLRPALVEATREIINLLGNGDVSQ